MKKILIILLLFICFICRVSATEGKMDTLTKIENSILGVDYSNQKIEQRLARLEEYVYGNVKQGSNNERLKKLANDVHSDLIGHEIEPTEDTLADNNDELTTDGSVDYPVLDDVESKLSIKSSPSQSLHSRLVAIEKKMFNKVYDTDDFYTRVERIKQDTYGRSDMLAQNSYEDVTIPTVNPDDYFNAVGGSGVFFNRSPHSFLNRNNTSNADYKLSALEQKILNSTYPDENNNDRLARLENHVFDTEFYYDNENARLKRLESAIKAQKTATKYDNNKFQQHLNAALQIGTMLLMVLACIL